MRRRVSGFTANKIKVVANKDGEKCVLMVKRNTTIEELITLYKCMQNTDGTYLRFIINGMRINSEEGRKKVCDFIDDNACIVQIDIFQEIKGGGLPAFSAPNPYSRTIKENWSLNAPSTRKVHPGVNLEFRHNNRLIIGRLKQTLTQKKTWDIRRDYKQAICEAINVHPRSINDVVDFWFLSCTVIYRGETTDGRYITKEVTYGDKASRHVVDSEWNWLNLIVFINEMDWERQSHVSESTVSSQGDIFDTDSVFRAEYEKEFGEENNSMDTDDSDWLNHIV